jgi:hypothetical protein
VETQQKNRPRPGIITDVSWPSGNPNQCARADTPAIAGDEGGHTPFAYLIGDLQCGLGAAAIADERHNHLLVGMAGPDWIDLIRLFFEGFEILIIDLADDINKHSALTIRFMHRDSRGHAPFGQHDYRGSNQSHL